MKKDAKALIESIQKKENQYRAARVKRIQQAIAAADLYDGELSDLEDILFKAWGRTKLPLRSK